MKKKALTILVILVLLMLATSTVFAEEYVDNVTKDSHKIRAKWNLQGTFVSERDPILKGLTWTYNVQIKEAMYGEYSNGVIEFVSGDNIITAHVEATKTNYSYWTNSSLSSLINENIAAVGWAEFNGEIYNFMFITSEGWIWIILSHDDYSGHWAAGNVYTSRDPDERVFELLALRKFDAYGDPILPYIPYDFDPFVIH